MKKFILKFWPVIFIFSLWFIFASPYFLKNKVPYASTYQVNFFTPWSHYEKFWGPVKNNAMPDVHTQIYPWKKLTIDTLKNGQIPFWNPYNFSGTPHLANFQTAVFSPFNLLFFLLPFIDAWSILILLQPLLAGLFTYLFLRSLKISRAGAVIPSVSFMFSGFMVVWMAYGTLSFAILYLPLALFAIEKYYSSKRLQFLVLLALTIPFSFFSGHFQISLYFLLTAISYILFKGLTERNLHNTCYLILATFLGLLIFLPQLIPSIQLYLNSVRSQLFLLSEAIPFSYLITAVAPDFLGNPVTRNDWFGHYAEWASFIGIWPFLLALWAIFQARTKPIIFFTLLGLASLLLAINSPLSTLFVSLKIPVLSTSALSRIIVLFSFSAAVLSGFGYDKLTEDIKKGKTTKKIVFSLGGVALFFLLTWSLLLVGRIISNEWLIVAKRNLILPTFLFLLGASLIIIVLKNKKFILIASCYLLIVISFDSLRFAQKWMPFDPKTLVYPQVPLIEAIKKNIGDGRIYGNLGTEVTTYYQIPGIEGYDPLYIGRYGEFLQSANNGRFEQAGRSVARLERRGKYTDRVLDLLGVNLIFQPIADTGQGWAYPVWDDKTKYELVYQDDKFQLYKNRFALPRVALFNDYVVVGGDKKQIIEKVFAPDFDFRKVLVLEEDSGIKLTKDNQGIAEIISYTPNKVTIKVKTESATLLFLSDNYYSGWKAKVNGVEAKIFRADYTFRAVVVSGGDSVVEFTYR